MKIYVDENQKYYETKSSAQTLTGVSIAGAILIILVDLDIIPLNMDITNKAIFLSLIHIYKPVQLCKHSFTFGLGVKISKRCRNSILAKISKQLLWDFTVSKLIIFSF